MMPLCMFLIVYAETGTGIFTSKPIHFNHKIKKLLNCSSSKENTWDKSATIKVGKESVHLNLSILPNITDPTSGSCDAKIYITGQLSDRQKEELAQGNTEYGIRITSKVQDTAAGKKLGRSESSVVPISQSDGQLRYFQCLVSRRELLESTSESLSIVIEAEIHVKQKKKSQLTVEDD